MVDKKRDMKIRVIIVTFIVALIYLITVQMRFERLKDDYDSLKIELDIKNDELLEALRDNEELKEKINELSTLDDVNDSKDILISEYSDRILQLEQEIQELKKHVNGVDSNDDSKGAYKEDTNKKVTLSSRGNSRAKVKEVLFEVTMYTNEGGAYSKDDPLYGTMANGEKTHIGAVAAPKSIPFGTKILLTDLPEGWEHLGKGVFVVKDRGGAIIEKEVDGKKVYCIDIYVGNKEYAYKWGRRIVKGYMWQ